jgi:hypothetical protein
LNLPFHEGHDYKEETPYGTLSNTLLLATPSDASVTPEIAEEIIL